MMTTMTIEMMMTMEMMTTMTAMMMMTMTIKFGDGNRRNSK